MSRGTAIELAYLVAAVCFILALKGLSSPRTARAANLVGVAGMVLAVAATFADERVDNQVLIAAGIAVGTVIGIPASRAIRMTAIPQMIAMFNGVGGAAAALVSLAEFGQADGDDVGRGIVLAAVFSTAVGAMSFTGSVVTFAKLQELMTGRPITFRGQRAVLAGLCAVLLGLAVAVVAGRDLPVLVLVAVVALAIGVAFVLPVGGADVPIVISLLNSFTGLAVAASGFVLDNTLLIVAGTLVGASGTLLTRLMSAAMGRSIASTLFAPAPTAGGGAAQDGADGADRSVRTGNAEDIAVMLAYARRVAIIPGYGLAVAQAQHTIHELAQLLEGRGVEVVYAIHPVAGRMPGHMNVLLAEANVPYEQLKEMDEVNPTLPTTDVALVVGANDVVNPAARDVPSSPIYGMPILEVDRATNVVFLKRSMRPGFAGIDNALLYEPNTVLLFGDAKESLSALVSAVPGV